jgi:lipid-binding SYLF domain-containing protein
MAATTNNNPFPMTFDGMIDNSHQVLDLALSARDEDTVNYIRPTKAERAIPNVLFRQCEGILLLHVIEAAFVISANIGTGLLMAHDKEENTWSAPSAVGLTGLGWGFLGGAARKDWVVFIMDKDTMNALTGNVSLNLSGQASFTIGERGREVDAALHASNRGVGATVAFSYSRGFLVGVSLEGSVVAPRTACNKQFYGRHVTPREVLYEMDTPHAVKDLHAKLQQLAEPTKLALYQVAQTQTGDESEDDTAMESEPPTEKNSSKEYVKYQVAQTQTDNTGDAFVIIDDDSDSDDMEFVTSPEEIEKEMKALGM